MISLIKTYIKNNKLLFLIFFLFIIIRLPLLDHAFLLRGERDIALTGWSLAKTGRDLYGNFLPIQFLGLDMPTPFLAFYWSSLWWILLPIKSVFMARLPFLVAASFNIFLVYELIKKVTKNNNLAFLTTIIFNFSPGMYHLSRLALEINIATPLLLIAILLFLNNKKILSYFVFILTFFAYNGFRPLILFLIIYLELFMLLDSEQARITRIIKNSIIGVVFFVVLFGISYFFIDGEMMRSRSNDLVFLSYEQITPLVDYRRNTATSPLFLKTTLNNKFTNTAYYILEVFFEGQSLDYLFLKGDKAAIYTSTFAGQFFVISLLFYYLGFFYLGKKWQKNYFYLLGFIPVALIPSLINIDYVSIAIRSILANIIYGFIIGCGAILFLDLVKIIKKQYRIITYSIIGLVLMIELVYFGYNYFYRRPVTMFEQFFQSEKDLTLYLININPKLKISIFDESPRTILTSYFLLNQKVKIQDMQKLLAKNDDFKFDHFILKRCPESGKKQQMFVKNTIIADSCLDEDQYEKLNSNGKINKIMFKDYSFRTAYFIINSNIKNQNEK